MSFDLKQKILIVDDARSTRRIIMTLLNSLGCLNTYQAEDGNEALSMIMFQRLFYNQMI